MSKPPRPTPIATKVARAMERALLVVGGVETMRTSYTASGEIVVTVRLAKREAKSVKGWFLRNTKWLAEAGERKRATDVRR